MRNKTISCLFGWLLFAADLLGQVPQIQLPRVALMPNQPAPYNLRNWQEVAVRYDSFVYDPSKSGQYLPLVTLQNNGFNYPQQPAFGLHTYVGTNSPNGNEAINVLPSIVGASLCGADKTTQFGRNWVLMSQDFFSKNDGSGIYLNNKGGGSGSDWWYDLMPNVYFYQICDLYPPAPGSEAAVQFVSVADKFLASVRALGGSETPWQAGNFDYRAFNFKTMQPNPNGVHEPEAAGAYAWVLYQAYLKTGKEDYRKGAEWALEFLQDWQTNPSYELQLPYGTLTAARMNAELGTQYNVEKMLNWSFDRGPLRGWGAIVGKWGNFDVSGLVGEANDAGNDYAFQLNGVQQAAALAPLTRYDKRFARAIGKWVLNLANATRLFYPGFLPGNYQDATIWSNSNDPQRVVGYEALRQVWQGLSPFSTGDAVNGNWAATNLSLYSTGSIGYLGSILEKTNVDKILKINVLKTDFFKPDSYPTFLYFNPYNTTKSIELDAGSAPADVYDAITESFLLQNISGPATLDIPANGVLLVTICPAGGAISYHRNKMMVNGVVVDFGQTEQAWQREPRIQSVAATQPEVEFGKTVDLFSKVQPGDSQVLEYFWTVSGGQLSSSNDTGQWTAPSMAGNQTLQLIVRDGNGLSDTALLLLNVVPEINKAPKIITIQQDKSYAEPGETLQCTCLASDPNDDPLTIEWTFTGGSFNVNDSMAAWTAPLTEGIFQVKCKATDDEGLSVEYTQPILVKNFDAAASGNMVAYYNFSGTANDQTPNQLHGQPFGTVYVPDVFGKPQRALSFNGVNSRVTVPLQPVLNFQEGITVSCWFRANDLPLKETFLVSHGSWQSRWKISFTPEKYLRWTLNTLNGIADLDSPAPFETDTFYHMAVTYDGKLMAIYVDGKLRSFKFHTGDIQTTTYPLLLAQMLPGNALYNFKGVLDEVQIFDYAIHPNAVETLYEQATTAVFSPSPGEIALEVSPNPATNQVQILLPGQQDTNVLLSVFDAGGRRVYTSNAPKSGVFCLDVKDWATGFYIVVVRKDTELGKAVFFKH